MNRLPIAISLSTVAVLASCTVHDDGGTCPEPQAAIVTGLSQSTLLAQSGIQLDAGLVQFSSMELSQPVQSDQFMLAVTANAQFAKAFQLNSPASLLARIGNFFISDANALSCAPPELVSQQPLADIIITSDAAVSAQYPAGSNLADIFRVGNVSTIAYEYSPPSSSIVARAPDNRETITEYLSAEPEVPLLLAMTLDIDDPVASQHVFTITYTLDDGNLYTTQTQPVSITP